MNNEKKILSYSELLKSIDQSQCILNKETLDYLDSLLNLKISVLQDDKNDFLKCSYLKQLEFFRNLVLYNLYKNSLKLVDDNTIVKKHYNRLSFGVKYEHVNFNIYSLDYNDVPNIYLYRTNSDLESINHNQIDFIILYAREAILERFLSRNNLKLSDFDDEQDLYGNKEKVKRYGYANIHIK